MSRFGVFIGCLPGNSDESELVHILKSFAKVTSIKLARGRNHGSVEFCRGYGFALCPTTDDVQRLLAIQTTTYRGRNIVFKAYKSGTVLKYEKHTLRQKRLFIGNIHPSVPEEILRLEFEKFGSLEAFYFVEQSKSMKFKYGYAVYQNIEDALRAAQHITTLVVHGSCLRVEFSGNINLDKNPPMQIQSSSSDGDGPPVCNMAGPHLRFEDDFIIANPAQLSHPGKIAEGYGKQPLQSGFKSPTSTAATPKIVVAVNRRSQQSETHLTASREPTSIRCSLRPSKNEKVKGPKTISQLRKPLVRRWCQDLDKNHTVSNIRLNVAGLDRHLRAENDSLQFSSRVSSPSW